MKTRADSAEAEALYRQMADAAHNPQEASWPLQSLARVYARDGRPGDAAGAIDQAIGMLQGTGNPASLGQLPYLRQALAGYLQQAGHNDQAEAIYRQMLSDPGGNGPRAVSAYANYLSGTQRREQAAKLVADYLENHPDSSDAEQMNLLYQLANMQSEPEKAAQYRSAAEQKRPANPQAGNVLDAVADDLQKAQKALTEGRPDEAFSLTIQAIGAASSSPRRDSLGYWQISQIADRMAAKQPARAEELYRNLLATAESWTADTVGPLEQTTAAYAGYLAGQPDRQGARRPPSSATELASSARGEDAAALAALDLSMSVARTQESGSRIIALAQEKLQLEESLTGPTSLPYLSALRTLAGGYQQNCDTAQALPLYRQIIAVTDLTALPPNRSAPTSAATPPPCSPPSASSKKPSAWSARLSPWRRAAASPGEPRCPARFDPPDGEGRPGESYPRAGKLRRWFLSIRPAGGAAHLVFRSAAYGKMRPSDRTRRHLLCGSPGRRRLCPPGWPAPGSARPCGSWRSSACISSATPTAPFPKDRWPFRPRMVK